MSDNNPLVSIIVPVYNVQEFLERCVNSLVGQSYNDLEIILVDDGSTDNSGKICDELKARDSRIYVIHQANRGLSAARNTGIDNCHGEYICFVDSDDYVHPDYVKYLYDMCQKNNCEIGICYHYITEEDDYYKDIDWNRKIEVYSRDEIFDMFYSEWHGSIVIAWNKIYKRACIGDIRYDEGIIHEDEATTFKYLYNAKKVAFGKEVLYYYYSRPNSITGRPYSVKNLDILKAYENRLIFYKEHDEKALYDRECQYYMSEVLNNYYKVYHFLNKDKETLKRLKGKYDKVYTSSDKVNWSMGRRLLYFSCKLFPLLYGTIKKSMS